MRLQVVENLFQAAVGGRSIAAFIERGFVLTEKAPGDDPEGKQGTIYLKRAFRCVIRQMESVSREPSGVRASNWKKDKVSSFKRGRTIASDKAAPLAAVRSAGEKLMQ